MFSALLSGFALGGSLIIAIGAQNAFVIRQGVINQYVFWVCAFCSLSDAILIWAGVFGLAAVLERMPMLLPIMRYGGALFLLWYGVSALRSALRTEAMAEANVQAQSLGAALSLCAAFTWLNPHVYLDTVVLVGSIANARADGEQVPFALGASLASLAWFFALGYLAKALRKVLSQPSVWKWIDFVIAGIMFYLAMKIGLGG